MNGLTGARVVIVDDEEKEALPVIREFSKGGVPCVYYKDINDLPSSDAQKPLGIRLAVLDMNLIGGTVSEKSMISTLLAYLRKVLRSDNGPYGVLIWTKHITARDLFEEEIFNVPYIPNPVFVVCISKYECTNKKGEFRLRKVASEISKALDGFSPLLLLQKWEETSFLSATQVTNQLANLSTRDAANLDEWRNLWKTEFLQLMRAMASAEAGQQLASDSVLNSLYESMNPLLADRMETNIISLRNTFSKHSTDILTAQQNISLHSRAKLNTMLHLALDGVKGFYAGNIYSRSKLSTQIPTVTKLLNDFLVGGVNGRKQNILNVRPFSKSVVIETNPFCDHSQNNVRIARFIAGLIVPENKSENIKKAEFIYKLGPVFLELKWLPAGEYYFYFSARHLLTMELSQVENVTPFARLRGQAFGDLQSWFSRQATRPGMLVL